MCLNKSASILAAARFVDSDNGDILSPKTAPETIAPATSAGFRPSVVPIPKNAIPIVDITVKALPTALPTIAHTTNTEGTNHWTLINLNPMTIRVGMIPACIHTAINEPTKIKIKIGMIPGLMPLMIPSCSQSVGYLFITAYNMTIPIAAKIVILGETFNPTTPIAMPKTITINTSVASKKLGVPFLDRKSTRLNSSHTT